MNEVWPIVSENHQKNCCSAISCRLKNWSFIACTPSVKWTVCSIRNYIRFLVLINSRLIITHRTELLDIYCANRHKKFSLHLTCSLVEVSRSGRAEFDEIENIEIIRGLSKQLEFVCKQIIIIFMEWDFLFFLLSLLSLISMFVCSSTTQVAAEVIISLVGWNYEVFNSIQYLIFSRVSLSYNNALCEDRAKSVLSVEGTKLVRFHVNQQLSSP